MLLEKIDEFAQTLRQKLCAEMLRSHQLVLPTISDERISHDAYLELERETTKTALMARAARAARDIFMNPSGHKTATEEIRAAWAELQKWPRISPELSAAFEAFSNDPRVSGRKNAFPLERAGRT